MGAIIPYYVLYSSLNATAGHVLLHFGDGDFSSVEHSRSKCSRDVRCLEYVTEVRGWETITIQEDSIRHSLGINSYNAWQTWWISTKSYRAEQDRTRHRMWRSSGPYLFQLHLMRSQEQKPLPVQLSAVGCRICIKSENGELVIHYHDFSSQLCYGKLRMHADVGNGIQETTSVLYNNFYWVLTIWMHVYWVIWRQGLTSPQRRVFWMKPLHRHWSKGEYRNEWRWIEIGLKALTLRTVRPCRCNLTLFPQRQE